MHQTRNLSAASRLARTALTSISTAAVVLAAFAAPAEASHRHHHSAEDAPHHHHHAHVSEAYREHLHRLFSHENRLAKIEHHEHMLHVREEHLAAREHHHHDSAHEERIAAREHHHHSALHDEHMAFTGHHHHSSWGHEERLAEHERHLEGHNRRLAALEARRKARFDREIASLSAHDRRVAIENEALHSGSVVQAAYAFEGSRYTFGGTSRSGFDCSGFTRYILGNAAGVELPRTAMEQYVNGEPVDRDSMKPGDLVFFKNTYKPGISHVGIYVGDGRFVHAANSHKGVVVESLSAPYYEKRFAGARRVIDRD